MFCARLCTILLSARAALMKHEQLLITASENGSSSPQSEIYKHSLFKFENIFSTWVCFWLLTYSFLFLTLQDRRRSAFRPASVQMWLWQRWVRRHVGPLQDRTVSVSCQRSRFFCPHVVRSGISPESHFKLPLMSQEMMLRLDGFDKLLICSSCITNYVTNTEEHGGWNKEGWNTHTSRFSDWLVFLFDPEWWWNAVPVAVSRCCWARQVWLGLQWVVQCLN